MDLAFVVYEGLTSLDLVGPLEVLSRMEYDPVPPYRAGSPQQAGRALTTAARDSGQTASTTTVSLTDEQEQS